MPTRADRAAATAKPARRGRRWITGLLALVALPLVFHGAVTLASRMTPPALAPRPAVGSAPELTSANDDPTRRDVGRSYARKRGSISEVRLVGDPVSIGRAHVKLLYDEQVAIERDLHSQFAHYVPWAGARLLITDMARLRFRSIDEVLSPRHRNEIASQAATFKPDPFQSMMPTYQRFVFLHTLYDIMLSFERSPLIGCTSLVVGPELGEHGHTLLARNFDFEGPQVLDDRKAVFLVFEEGLIPYASVSWPGFVGASSGMNREGLAIVIHGARAGEPRVDGMPVAQTVRDLLGQAHRTREALTLLSGRDPMVPHMLVIADALGDTVVVERVPGRPMFVRERTGATLPVTNHFEGPAASDPKNQEVMAATSTLARRARLDEIVSNLPAPVSVQAAVKVLRDKRAAGGVELPLGHRSAIDALIATHSLVMDTTSRELWVSEGPHATGRYLRFDLRQLLDPQHDPVGPAGVVALPADDIATDGRYEAWVRDGQQHGGVE